MKTAIWMVIASFLAGMASVPARAESPGQPRVVRVIDSTNPEPPIHNWHEHNRLGIERAAFVGVESFNRVLLREESGDVVSVPFFHFTSKDLGELMHRMATFPEETRVIAYAPTDAPLVDLRADELEPGALEQWPNHGVLGGQFHSMNVAPEVVDILGRRAVKFNANHWYFDTEYTAMVLDALPADALKDGRPFTFSAWILHPDRPTPSDGEALMTWHTRGGNNGSAIDWKRAGVWGDFYVDGMGGDLNMEPPFRAEPMPEWTHVAFVYTGGGIDGELRVYDNGRLTGVSTSDYVPELRPPTEITTNSVVLNGYLHTRDPDVVPYVRGYIGEYDAFHFGQLRHIGRWDQMNEIGLTPRGDFTVPFRDLKPGTRYYYRMFATMSPESYAISGEPTKRWARGSGQFITATEDGQPGVIIPDDEDRFIFLGAQWGSRWYTSYPGPANIYRGYFGDVKLFDRALSDDEIRREAGAQAPSDGVPMDASVIDVERTDFSWKSGSAETAAYLFRLDTDRGNVENGTAEARKLTETTLPRVTLQPGRTHYWRVDALDAEGNLLAAGPIWSFHVTYAEPSLPTPPHESEISATGFFRWTQTFSDLASQRLYIGEDPDAVRTATVPVEQLHRDRRDFFAPRDMIQPGVTYYWRIENELSDGRIVPGPLWSFTAAPYFTPEFDGPVSEPYPAGITPSRAAKHLEGMGHPTISTPRADEETLRHIGHATERFLRKSLALRNHLASRPGATTMSSHEGPPCVDGFVCGSYGGMPFWNMTMHEMGHQVEMHGMTHMDPLFWRNLINSFNTRADTNAWLGDYAAVNVHENMAISAHQFISVSERESLLNNDAPTYHLLAKHMPGDLAVDLHPADGLTVDGRDVVVHWENRGGVEDRVPGGEHYAPVPEGVGVFHAAGSPTLRSVQGVTAVDFDGQSALLWDRGFLYGFKDNRAWSLEAWVRHDTAPEGEGVILGWGPADRGVRLYWGDTGKAWSVCGTTADWPVQPATGRWHHVAVVFEGGGEHDTEGELSLFLNGEKILTERHRLDLEAGMPVHVGGLVADGQVSQGFTGSLAHARLHDYALSIEQVIDHYRVERSGYERSLPPHVGGHLLVDLNALLLEETGAERHRPLYPESLNKPWVRSWSNKGLLQGRVHNDIDALWHYSGSTPLYRLTDGRPSLRFMGKDRMVGVMDVRGSALEQPAGSLELVVYSEAQTKDEVVLEWGSFILDTGHLVPGWQHVAVVPDGGHSAIYVNGTQVGTVPGILKPAARERLHLGAHFDPRRESWYRYFNGAIAEIRVHTEPLTADQIAANARFSPVFAAHQPIPADRERVAPDRNPMLDWSTGLSATGPEVVRFGTDPAQLGEIGSFRPGMFQPELAPGTRYFWQVGQGPVWSFETRMGELVSLDAAALPEGTLEAWPNKGTAEGAFVPSDRGDLLGLSVESFNDEIGLRLENGRRLTFTDGDARADALKDGPYTIMFRVTSDNHTESVPFLNWGTDTRMARVWFGTSSNDRRLITLGEPNIRRSHDAYPADQLKMIFPEGCNARMAFIWKTITLTYDKGVAEMWYNGRRFVREEMDLSVADLGDLVLGWDAEEMNGTILLNDLRIYDRLLREADIVRLSGGERIRGAAPVIHLSAEALKPGSRAAQVANNGRLGGAFVSAPETDRRPAVAEVAGRNAVVFDGVAMLSSDFVLPEVLADARPFTVEVWALQNGPSRDARLLAFSQEISGRHTSFAMGSHADRGAIVRPHSRAEWHIPGTEQPGEWVHLAWVYEGGMQADLRLYRNGVLTNTHPFRTIDTIGGYPMTIGGIMNASVAQKALFQGAISSVRVFDYPRTAEEIADSAAQQR